MATTAPQTLNCGMQQNETARSPGRALAYWTLLAILAIRLLILQPIVAATPEVPAAQSSVAATIRKTIEARFPGAHVLDVQPSAMPGIYELFMGDEVVYTDASADYLLMGPMVDTQTRQNLTEARMSERGKIDFSSLPLDKAIKIVKGNGSRTFAVFSDPDCPFCQQIEKSLLPVTNITMYVFLYPIPSLHPQSPAKARAIWCAHDRVQAWNDWMRLKKLPPDGHCTGDPIDSLRQLGDRLHIDSTPTLFFSNGRRVAGAIPTADIERMLASSNR